MKKTEFQTYLSYLNNLIKNKMHKNTNPYLSALFMSFIEDSQKEKKRFEKIRKQKLRQKPLQSDPLLPPFEVGVYICDISVSHCLLFDVDPKFKGQMIITTKDFEFQNMILNPKDIEACLRFIKSTEGFVMYKSNEKVGAKFNHKHIHAWLSNDYLPFMELYSKEIIDKRQNFNKPIEVIHAKVNELNNFEYMLVGFEKITEARKDISLSVHNMRDRAKAISKFYSAIV